MDQPTETLLTEPVLQARCKWCEKRIGEPTVRVGNGWLRLSMAELSGSVVWTDAICPACYLIAVDEARRSRKIRQAQNYIAERSLSLHG